MSESEKENEEWETSDIIHNICKKESPYLYNSSHLSTCKYEKDSIIICGGLSNNSESREYVWKLDIKTNKYEKFLDSPLIASGNRTFYANKKLFFFCYKNEIRILDGNELFKKKLSFGLGLNISDRTVSTMTLTTDKKFIHIIGGYDHLLTSQN